MSDSRLDENLVYFYSIDKTINLCPVFFFHENPDFVKKREFNDCVYKFCSDLDLGNSEYESGIAFECGRDGKVDYSKAFSCFRKGALQGHGKSCAKLAFYYLYGLGCGFKSRALASIYLKEAVRLGVKECRSHLRVLESLPRDIVFKEGIPFPSQSKEL